MAYNILVVPETVTNFVLVDVDRGVTVTVTTVIVLVTVTITCWRTVD